MKLKISTIVLGTVFTMGSMIMSQMVSAETEDERITRMSNNAEYYKLVKRVMPDYPRKAARDNIVGHVVVEYSIDTNGKVVESKVIDAVPEKVFDEAALVAVSKWKYKPNFGDAEPGMAMGRTKIRFAP